MSIRNTISRLSLNMRSIANEFSDGLMRVQSKLLVRVARLCMGQKFSEIDASRCHQSERKSPILRALAFSLLVAGCIPAHSAGEHVYLAEGNSLVLRLTEILIASRVCSSFANCSQKNGGLAFVKPESSGLEVSVFGIQEVDVASKILKECVDSFTTRNIGDRLTVKIFEGSKNASLRQSILEKSAPSFLLKLEK